MSFHLKRKNVPLPADDAQHAVYPLEIECTTETVGLSPKVFVYRAGLGLQPGLGDVFSCIASAAQLRQLPEDAPGTDSSGRSIPFFRKNVLKLDCTYVAQIDRIWEDVVAQVRDLHDDISLESEIQETATVDIT